MEKFDRIQPGTAFIGSHEQPRPFLLRGFEVVSDVGQEAVYQKLQNLRTVLESGKKVQVRMDFDRTLTRPRTNDEHRSSFTWEAAASVFEGEILTRSRRDRTRNLNLQASNSLPADWQERWSIRELGRLAEHELGRLAMGTSGPDEQYEAAQKIAFRDGTDELFRLFDRNSQLEPIIVSAGVASIIELALELNGYEMPRDNVIANRYGVAVVDGEFRPQIHLPLITTETKRMHLDNLMSLFSGEPEYIEPAYSIALGDSVTDAAMADELKIRTCQAGGNNQDYIVESRQAGFDLVMQVEDLLPLPYLFEELVLAA